MPQPSAGTPRAACRHHGSIELVARVGPPSAGACKQHAGTTRPQPPAPCTHAGTVRAACRHHSSPAARRLRLRGARQHSPLPDQELLRHGRVSAHGCAGQGMATGYEPCMADVLQAGGLEPPYPWHPRAPIPIPGRRQAPTVESLVSAVTPGRGPESCLCCTNWYETYCTQGEPDPSPRTAHAGGRAPWRSLHRARRRAWARSGSAARCTAA